METFPLLLLEIPHCFEDENEEEEDERTVFPAFNRTLRQLPCQRGFDKPPTPGMIFP